MLKGRSSPLPLRVLERPEVLSLNIHTAMFFCKLSEDCLYIIRNGVSCLVSIALVVPRPLR
jgi:hypothetical protein